MAANRQSVMVKANMENLNRAKLKEEFSKFGMVTKIFIHPEDSYAKVYLDNLEGLTQACNELNGVNNWNLSIFLDEPRKRNKNGNCFRSNNFEYTQGLCSSIPDTDQEMTYVDIHGRDIEVVQDDNDKLYVSLDDVKASGFHIFSKHDFENSSLLKDADLDQFRQFLLNQGKNYILTFKKNFSEKEILNVFQRVEEALIDPSKPTFGNNRQVHVGQSGHFSITTANNVLPPSKGKDSERNASRGSVRVPDNMRPAAGHFQNDKRTNQQGRGFRDNRNEMNHTNTNSKNQTRRPRQFKNRSTDNQATSKNVDEEKWDEDITATEQHIESPNDNVKPNLEPRKSDIVNRLQASPKSCNQTNIHKDQTPAVSSVTKQETNTTQSKPAKPQTPVAELKTEERDSVKYADLKSVEFSMGISDYVCYSCTGETVSLLPFTDEVIGQLGELSSFVPTDTEPYFVDLMAVCLAKFNDVWCRGLVTELKDTNMREVLFLDYGNTEDINVNEIRRFPENLKSIPILAATARFEGIPDKQSVHDRIKELMPDQSLVNVNVLKANADLSEYTIEVSSVYTQLRNEGLI